jgi:hypothetical protein
MAAHVSGGGVCFASDEHPANVDFVVVRSFMQWSRSTENEMIITTFK